MSTTATKTTKDKVKEMFKSGQILTSCGAAKDFLTADLRRIITTLKKEGMDIVDRWATSTTSKRYKEYFLREFTPKEVTPDAPVEPISVPAGFVNPDPSTSTCPDDVPVELLRSVYPPQKQQQTLFE